MTNPRLLSLFFILTLFNAQAQECYELKDGEYHFKHKEKVYKQSNFILIIRGEQYSLVKQGGEESNGKLEQWDCMLKLLNEQWKIPENLDSLSSFDKTIILTRISNGGLCYELIGKRRFRLTYCGNLHITCTEGRIRNNKRKRPQPAKTLVHVETNPASK